MLIKKAITWLIACLAVVAALVAVWKTSQPFDVEVKLNEASVHNDSLPSLENAVVTMTLDNETKTDTIRSIDGAVHFTNIPHRFLNQEVRITVKCDSFLDVDTTLHLSKSVSVNIRRNPQIYGDIHFGVWNPNKEHYIPDVELEILGNKVVSDSEGKVSLFIPLEQQRKKYKVKASIPLDGDTIYMPCGEDGVIEVK